MGLIIGRAPVQNSLPSWYPSDGEIVEVPTVQSLFTYLDGLGAGSYPQTTLDSRNIVTPWSGAAILTVNGDPYLAHYGGGHGDGSWNGIPMLGPLTADAPDYSLHLAASALGDVRDGTAGNLQTYADGRQVSCHTYNNLVGVNDRLYHLRTDAPYADGGDGEPFGYYFTGSGQTQIANHPGTDFTGSDHYAGNIYTIGSSGDQLRIYNIAGNSYTTEPGAQISLNISPYPDLAVDTNRGAILATDGTNTYYWNDVTNLSERRVVNDPGFYLSALEFDAGRDVFVCPQSGSRNVSEVDASSLGSGNNPAWSTRAFTGVTPVAAPTQGIFGRFRYVSDLSGYIYTPTIGGSTYFYRSS